MGRVPARDVQPAPLADLRSSRLAIAGLLRAIDPSIPVPWGGGKILNALLFNGERIVPESGNDMRRQAGNGCYYHHCKANQLYACILQQSDFGEALLSIGGERVPDQLQRPIVDLQRFFYKLCELRKVNQLRRCVYFRTFTTADARQRWLQRHRDSGNIVVTALW